MSKLITTRQALDEDLDDILRVEETAWPEPIRASRQQLAERLSVYPSGFHVACVEQRIVGFLTSQLVNHSPDVVPLGWEITTAKGWIRSTHQAAGNALCVVSVGVAAAFQRCGAGSQLIVLAQQHAAANNLQAVLLDSRLPGYAPYCQRGMSVEEYVRASDSQGMPLDAELRFYARLGFRISSEAHIIRNCMSLDDESASYGVRLVWTTEHGQ
jgi:ribosomal protein S18 acetylase RimI-like enzyme